jgi:hypothetical protein
MALSKNSAQKAFSILSKLNGGSEAFDIQNDVSLRTGIILVSDPKTDGGFESVALQIRNITTNQLEFFESRKKEVPNSSVVRKLEEDNEITRIGWF